MTKVGFHQYPPMDQVIFGKPAGQALREEAEKRDAKRVFLIVSRTLNTQTDEIEKIRNALGGRYAGTFDGVPQHTTRASAVDGDGEGRSGEGGFGRRRGRRIGRRCGQDRPDVP